MSTFEGKLEEPSLYFIRIDNFEKKNFDGTAYFLSHFHTDHRKGLFDEEFANAFNKRSSTILYCSDFTRSLILKTPDCKLAKNKIFALELNSCHIIESENEDVCVTALPAGHCPGSIMFLFNQQELYVLYTGDFRMTATDMAKLNAVHDGNGSLINVTSLYLDTTFCHPKWLTFPTRQDTEEDVLSLVSNWLESNPTNQVGIWYNSYYGLEFLLIHLARTLKVCIWVIDRKSFENYSLIPELCDSLYKSKGASRIHLCPVKTQENCWQCVSQRAKTKTIKPCAQTFNQSQLEQSRIKQGPSVTRVAYATHCSLKELIDIVKYLTPKKIIPCVIPTNSTKTEILNNLTMDVLSMKKHLSEEEELNGAMSPPKKRHCASKDKDDNDWKNSPTTAVLNLYNPLPVPITISSDEDDVMPLTPEFLNLDSPPL